MFETETNLSLAWRGFPENNYIYFLVRAFIVPMATSVGLEASGRPASGPSTCHGRATIRVCNLIQNIQNDNSPILSSHSRLLVDWEFF